MLSYSSGETNRFTENKVERIYNQNLPVPQNYILQTIFPRNKSLSPIQRIFLSTRFGKRFLPFKLI